MASKLHIVITLPATNMDVKYGLLKDCFPLQTGGFPLPWLFQGVYYFGTAATLQKNRPSHHTMRPTDWHPWCTCQRCTNLTLTCLNRRWFMNLNISQHQKSHLSESLNVCFEVWLTDSICFPEAPGGPWWYTPRPGWNPCRSSWLASQHVEWVGTGAGKSVVPVDPAEPCWPLNPVDTAGTTGSDGGNVSTGSTKTSRSDRGSVCSETGTIGSHGGSFNWHQWFGWSHWIVWNGSGLDASSASTGFGGSVSIGSTGSSLEVQSALGPLEERANQGQHGTS